MASLRRSGDDARHLEDMILDVRARKEGNQYCADCGVPSPEYLNLTIGTFICEVCADIHRSTSNRHVKDIFAGTLTLEDVRRMDVVGNDVANRRFLATWNPSEIPQPSRSERTELKEFVSLKYNGAFKKPTQQPQASPFRPDQYPPYAPAAPPPPSQGTDPQKSYWVSKFSAPTRSQPPPNAIDDFFSRRGPPLDNMYRSTMPPVQANRFQPPVQHSRSAYAHPPPPPPPSQRRQPMYPPPPSIRPSYESYEHLDSRYHPTPQQSHPYSFPEEDLSYHHPHQFSDAPYNVHHQRHDLREDHRIRQSKKKSQKDSSRDATKNQWYSDEDDGVARDEEENDTASTSGSGRREKKKSTSKKESKKKTKVGAGKTSKSSYKKTKDGKNGKRHTSKHVDDSDDVDSDDYEHARKRDESDDEIPVRSKKKSSKKKTVEPSDSDEDSIQSTSADGLEVRDDSSKSTVTHKAEFDLMSEWMGDSKETDGSIGVPSAAAVPNVMASTAAVSQPMPMPNPYQTAAHMPFMAPNMYGTVVPGMMTPFAPHGQPFIPGMHSMHPNMPPMPGLVAGMQGLTFNPGGTPNLNAVNRSMPPPPPPPLGMPAGPPPGPPPGGPPNE